MIEEQARVQERVVESLVADFLPELVSGIFNSSAINTSGGSETLIRTVYNSLSDKLNVSQSEIKFNKFVEAVTEIAAAEEEVCGGSDALSTSDIPRIVADFNAAFSFGRNGDITTVRALYGQMLCIRRREEEPPTKRRKRQTLDFLDCKNLTVSGVCKCPAGSLEEVKEDEITCPCHFFRCIDPYHHLKPILGFVKWVIQCLAFVIDTTGSMSEEIYSAQHIIKEFVRAEEDLGEPGCYLLVPFNDVGPDTAHVPNASKQIKPHYIILFIVHMHACINQVG